MKTWVKVTIGIGTALALAGCGIGVYKWLNSEEHKKNKGKKEGNDPNKNIEEPDSVIGKEVYSDGGANLRFENYVDNRIPTNIIASGFRGTIGTLEKVGRADQEEAPDDLYDWYYVKLNKPIDVPFYDVTTRASSGEHTHCWVRSDNVKIR